MRRKWIMNLLSCLSFCFGFFILITSGCSTSTQKHSPEGLAAEGNEFIVQHQVVPLTGPLQVHRYAFRNGLRLLVVEDHSSPTLAYQTWFRVGSRDESVGKTGLAHLFEHMMFKETKNLKDGEFDRLLEGAGAEGENAFTNRDYTAYVQELPKDKLELITRLEAERMINLTVNESAFRTETEVVQNERRFRNENSPDGLMYQELFELAFTKHPYHWPVVGYQKDLASMSAKDAQAFYKTFYSPNHATIVVTGDVQPAQVASLIEKYYGQIPAQIPPSKEIPPEPLQNKVRRKTLKLNIQVEKLIMGYHSPDIKHEDIPALTVLQSILGSGKSSRLNQALVESGIATSAEASSIDDKDPALFVIGVNLQKGKQATAAEAVVLNEIAKLGKQQVTASELERAKNKIHFEFYQAMESNFMKAYVVGLYDTIAGDFRVALQQHDKINAITPIEVLRVARKYFNPNSRTVILGVRK